MPEAAIAPAPGPELKLGAPQNAPANMPNSILAAALKAAGASEEPEPPQDTPEAPKTTPSPAKAQEKASEKAVEKPVMPAAKPTEAPKEPKALREAYDRATAKAEELSRSLDATAKEKADAFRKAADLEAKLAEREKKIAEDYEPRVKRLDAAEKRIQQAEEQLRIQNYMATTEFHDKYVKPIADTQQELAEMLSTMEATVDGQVVPAKPEHFNFILAAPTANEAARRSREVFGPDLSPQMVNFWQKLGSLERTRAKAASSAHKDSIDHFNNQQSAVAQAREMLRSKIAEREAVHVADFKPADDDPDLGAAFNEGLAFANEVLVATPESLGHDKFADTVAKARSKIIKASVVDKKLSAANAKIAALEEQLAAYHKSDPDVETRRGGKPLGTTEETAETKLLAAAMKLATGQK